MQFYEYLRPILKLILKISGKYLFINQNKYSRIFYTHEFLFFKKVISINKSMLKC
jgi:hypothetical protein